MVSQVEGMRDFIKVLESEKELVRVTKEVDAKFELAAVLKKIELETGQAALFEKVKNKMPVVGGLYGSLRRIALGLSVSEYALNELIRKAPKRMQPVKVVNDAPVLEVVSKDVDLSEYPIVTGYEKDAGPYITADVTVSKHPITGRQNIGIYRIQVAGKKKLRVFTTMRNLGTFHSEAEKLGKPLDVAICIGVDPATIVAAAMGRSLQEIDELQLAAGLRGKPTEVIQCKTVDLLAPSTSEIILEGRMLPNIREYEGPFAEFMGYYGDSTRALGGRIVEVTAVMRHRSPIYQTILGGPSREHWILGSGSSFIFLKPEMLATLKNKFPNVKDLYMPIADGVNSLLLISICTESNEDPSSILKTVVELLNLYFGFVRTVVIVDEDVNIYDIKDVLWAVGTRLKDARKFDGTYLRLGIDATKPLAKAKELERAKIPNLEAIKLEEYIERNPK